MHEQLSLDSKAKLAKTKLNTPNGGGPTVQRRSARLAERQASSASVPFAPGRSPSPVLPESPTPQSSQVQSPLMSRPSIATLAQPSASPILSPSPVLPESPQPISCVA